MPTETTTNKPQQTEVTVSTMASHVNAFNRGPARPISEIIKMTPAQEYAQIPIYPVPKKKRHSGRKIFFLVLFIAILGATYIDLYPFMLECRALNGGILFSKPTMKCLANRALSNY